MNYLLDTCVLSELRKPGADRGLVSWAKKTDESCMFLSVLNLGEIQKGIAKLRDGAKKRALQDWLEHDLRSRFADRILALDLVTALAWGTLVAACEEAGHPVPVVDGLLAAVALGHDLAVVTRNVQHFTRCRVRVVNPWNG